jgi:peptide deformylase
MDPAPLKIRLYGDPCLRRKSKPLKEVGPGERLVFQAMIETMRQAKGVGLAAPQVGINQRFFVTDVGSGPLVMINPRIIKKVGICSLEEGCLSIPQVTIEIKRPQQVTVRFMNEDSLMMEMICEDLMARVILHETDHLDGKLIIDYAKHSEKVKFKEQLKALEAQYKK